MRDSVRPNRGGSRLHRDRVARRIQEVCADARSTAEIIEGLREPFNEALGLSGMLLSATDPDTTALGTATVVEHLPEEIATPWMENEFLVEDFNKFAKLHRTGQGPVTLHRSSQGHPQLSPRYRELHQPMDSVLNCALCFRGIRRVWEWRT